MEVWQILSHSFLHLLRNFEKLIKITGVLIGLIILLALKPVFFPQDFIFIDFILIIISSICSFWVYVATFRFMLKDETPSSVIPKFHVKVTFLCFWRTCLLLFCVTLPLLVCFGFIVYIFDFNSINSFLSSYMSFIQNIIENPDETPIFDFQLTNKSKFILFIFVVSFFYFLERLGLIITATAIDVKLRISESWQATKGYDALIILLSIFSLVYNWSGYQIYTMVSPNPTLLSLYLIFINYFGVWFWVSVRTTLYQYLVEKRPLV